MLLRPILRRLMLNRLFREYISEAEQAYLRRKERRERQQRLSAMASGSVLNPAAASFPATDC